LDPKTLVKKAAVKAALSPGTMISGAVAVATSAALWNPLPLILWGLGSAGWVSLASTGQRYQKQVLAEERQNAEAQAQAERAAAFQKVQSQLAEAPVAGWVRRGLLPDYLQVFRRLNDVRDRVARILHDRSEMDAGTQEGIVRQLDYMLGAYVQFVRERIGYLQILANVRPGSGPNPDAVEAVPPPPPSPPMPVAPAPNRWQRSGKAQPRPAAPEEPAVAAPPNVDQRLAEIDGKVGQLKALAEKEPATAKTREWHIGILEKQRELLLDCQKRDQCVVAQLGAFSDVFEVILGRVSAAQFSATEVASYMGNVVDQIEETERFVASLRPAVDQLMGGVELIGERI
jgi:plasmid stabilization system protein ParE